MVSLLVEETRVPEENQRPTASHRQNSSHNVVLYTVHLAMSGIRTHNISGNRYWLHRSFVNPTTIQSWLQQPHNIEKDGRNETCDRFYIKKKI